MVVHGKTNTSLCQVYYRDLDPAASQLANAVEHQYFS